MTETAMKSHPMIFSAPMILALLAGRKTQTRRVVKPIKVASDMGTPQWDRAWIDPSYLDVEYGNVPCLKIPFGGEGVDETTHRHFPDWEPGDTIWVREKWRRTSVGFIAYAASDSEWDHASCRWKSPIHLGRKDSRITLEIQSVRVERVHGISESDAIAEGIERVNQCGILRCSGWKNYGVGDGFINPIESYRSLWDSINGEKHPWSENPHVWVISFSRNNA